MGGFKGIKKPQHNSVISNSERTVSGVQEINKPRQYSGDLMPPEDAARYNQYWDNVAKGLDTDTRVK